LLFGTLSGHSNDFSLISFGYSRHSNATVERREASACRWTRAAPQ
jgi:hypothetical protein